MCAIFFQIDGCKVKIEWSHSGMPERGRRSSRSRSTSRPKSRGADKSKSPSAGRRGGSPMSRSPSEERRKKEKGGTCGKAPHARRITAVLKCTHIFKEVDESQC